jgi:hypothetical protein
VVPVPDPAVVKRATDVSAELASWAADPSGSRFAGSDILDVRAYAGAGKTRALVQAVHAAVAKSRRVIVVANTNDQVHEIVDRVSAAGVVATHYAAEGKTIDFPPPGINSTHDASELPSARCVIATVYKAGRTANKDPGLLGHFDVGFVDEAYQVATSAEALWLMDHADRWAFIGDPGQIDVFTTLENTPTIGQNDPVTSIVESSRRSGAAHAVLAFDWTYRLPQSGAQILGAFYDQTAPAAATLADRRFDLAARRRRRGIQRYADAAVDVAAQTGWGYLELAGVGTPTDRQVAEGMASTVRSLLERNTRLTCERDGTRDLVVDDVGVAVATNAQVALVTRSLADVGITSIEVRTFNRQQGLEYAVNVCWHPLSGPMEPNGFSLDVGRLCVAATRHRHACILVGRESARSLVADPPVTAEAPWPGQPDRLFGGWHAHSTLIAHLDSLGATVEAS